MRTVRVLLRHPASGQPIRGKSVPVRLVGPGGTDDHTQILQSSFPTSSKGDDGDLPAGTVEVTLAANIGDDDDRVTIDNTYYEIKLPGNVTKTIVVPSSDGGNVDDETDPDNPVAYWWLEDLEVQPPPTPDAPFYGLPLPLGDEGEGVKIVGGVPVWAPDSTATGTVTSINDIEPDVDGNVTLDAGDVGADPEGAADDAEANAIAAATAAVAAEAAARSTADALLIPLTQKGAANGVATLDGSQLVPSAQIPAIAITDYLGSIASQAAMLALSGQKGDWAVRTDLGTTWVITGSDPTQLASWTQLSYPTAPVTSVNSQTGAVNLGAADVGAQPVDVDLTTIAALDATQSGVIASDGAGWFRKTYAQVKTALGLTKSDVGLGNVDNTSDANKPVSTAQQAALDLKAPLASPVLTGNPTAPTQSAGDNSTKLATTAYADAAAVAATVGLLDYRGTYNASGNTFPSSGGSGAAGAVVKGDFWVVSTPGTLGGTAVTNGDLVIALTDTPGQTVSNWDLVEHDLGYAPENVANKDTDGTLAANSDTKYPSQKATKTYADSKVEDTIVDGVTTKAPSQNAVNDALALKIAASLIDAKGDLLTGTANDTIGRHAAPSDQGVMIADSAQADGWRNGFLGIGVFGDGSDGAVTFDGSTTVLGMAPSGNVYTLTRDLVLASSTINNGVSLNCKNFRVFCNGTLTNNGTIHANGGDGSGVGGGSSNNSGSLGTANNHTGGSGGNPGAGSAGTNASTTLGGAGGAGGSGPGGAGGAAGTAGAPGVQGGSMRTFPNALVLNSAGLANGATPIRAGAGGGGGAGDGVSSAGGGGGGGGGLLVVAAFKFAGTGSIRARGGAGATQAGGNRGGGGGGGGGTVAVISTSVSGGAISGQTIDANGGAGGTGSGTGTNGANGSNGATIILPA